MRDDRERILDMLEAIENIERHAGKGREVFESDELIQTWVVHHPEIIGLKSSARRRQGWALNSARGIPRFPGPKSLRCGI